MASDAVFGFVGVLLGSLTTSVLTVYRERLVVRRERETRREQDEAARTTTRNVFQRESVLALQDAASDLIRAAYGELDRLLAETEVSGRWSARHWETPTAVGWSDAILRLETARARVFDDELRSWADKIRTLTGESVWAPDLDTAKQRSEPLESLLRQFNARVTAVLPELY
jgi:hypothetical protein